MTMAIRQHPAVMAASFDVDVASTNIRIAEGTLLPSASIQGSASKSRNNDPTLGTFAEDQASIVANVTAPIYDGGQAAAQTRQAKEITAQSRLVLDQVRNQARTAAVRSALQGVLPISGKKPGFRRASRKSGNSPWIDMPVIAER